MTSILVAYIVSSALAATTSGLRLSQGCHEGNPLMPNRPGWNVAAKAGTTVGLSLTFSWAERKDRHVHMGRWLALGATGVNLLDATHNLRLRCP